MGIPDDVCMASVRFSLSCQTTEDEVRVAADRIAGEELPSRGRPRTSSENLLSLPNRVAPLNDARQEMVLNATEILGELGGKMEDGP